MSGKAQRSPGTLADVFEPLPEVQRRPGLLDPVDVPDNGELWSAGRRFSAIDRADAPLIRIERGFEPILDELNRGLPESEQWASPAAWMKRGDGPGTTDPGAIDYARRPSRRETWQDAFGPAFGMGQQQVTFRQQVDLIFAEIRRRRANDPGFLAGVPDTWAAYHAQLLERDARGRQEAGATLARSPGGFMAGAASLGGAAWELQHDPINITATVLGFGLPGGGGLVMTAAREALFNGSVEALTLPLAAANRAEIGEELTTGEALFNVGAAAAFGAAIPTVATGAGRLGVRVSDWTVGKVFAAMPEAVQTRWAARMKVGDMPLTEFYAGLSHAEAAEFAGDLIGAERMTPDERAAIAVLEQAELTASSSPFAAGPAGDAEHVGRLDTTLRNLIESRPLPLPAGAGRGADGGGGAFAPLVRPPAVSTPAVRPRSSGLARVASVLGDAAERFKQRVRRAESGGDDRARNPRSSAENRYQFTDATWADYYVRRYGGTRAEALRKKAGADIATQEQLMDDLTADNSALLEAGRQAVTPGNLYLVHFLGPRAVKVLQADPSTPIARLVPDDFIAANPEVLGGGKSASEVIAWAHRKMGGDAASVAARPGVAGGGAASEDPAIAQLRERSAAIGSEQAIGEELLPAGGSLPPMRTIRVRPQYVRVDAERFQFKSGGDAQGVSERLRGVEEWNPILAGRQVFWQDGEGQMFVADGHQRLGLARRIEAEHGAAIELDGVLLREADGVTAEDARTWAALKNIAEGTGTAVDAAKVIRQVGDEVLAHLPPRSALVRDGAALARLSDEAFGAVYNGMVAPDIAAVVGHLLPDDPDAHAGMMALLIRLDPANRGQAESIVRQGIAAGFHRETQEDLFGSFDTVNSLFLERAKVLERGLSELRKLKGVFGVASRNADTLEGAGSKIARARAQEEAAKNVEAIEIVSRLAFAKGPVADALNAAAARLAAGAGIGDVVTQFVADVRGLELNALGRAGAGDSGRLAPDGAGRGGDGGGEGQPLPPQRSGGEQPGLLELEAATARFSDPDGPAVREQAESALHDFKADTQAPAPRAQPAAAMVDRGEPGFSFRLSDEGDETTAAELLAEIEADDAAIAAIKGCL